MSLHELSDEALTSMSLRQWANYIETGDVAASAQDAKNMAKPEMVNALNESQMKAVIRLRELANEIGDERVTLVRRK